mgnify:FL=1
MSISLYLEDRERRMMDNDYLGELHLKHHTYKPQYAKFTDARSVYAMTLRIYDDSLHRKKSGGNILMYLQGRIVYSVIESVLDNAQEDHLKAIINRCNDRLKQLEKKEVAE